jgi:MFS family permease
MILFATMSFVGPALGLIVSGSLQLTKTWRWTFYVLIWMAAPTISLLYTIPETLPAMALCGSLGVCGRQTVERTSMRLSRA